jgi:hypothetical protein
MPDINITIQTPSVVVNQVDLTPVLDRLTTLASLITSQGVAEMAVLDDLEAKLTAAETAGDAVATLLATIHQELVDMIAAGPDTAALQAMADRLDADAVKWKAAADANPDPTPAPPPAPPPTP